MHENKNVHISKDEKKTVHKIKFKCIQIVDKRVEFFTTNLFSGKWFSLVKKNGFSFNTKQKKTMKWVLTIVYMLWLLDEEKRNIE